MDASVIDSEKIFSQCHALIYIIDSQVIADVALVISIVFISVLGSANSVFFFGQLAGGFFEDVYVLNDRFLDFLSYSDLSISFFFTLKVSAYIYRLCALILHRMS